MKKVNFLLASSLLAVPCTPALARSAPGTSGSSVVIIVDALVRSDVAKLQTISISGNGHAFMTLTLSCSDGMGPGVLAATAEPALIDLTDQRLTILGDADVRVTYNTKDVRVMSMSTDNFLPSDELIVNQYRSIQSLCRANGDVNVTAFVASAETTVRKLLVMTPVTIAVDALKTPNGPIPLIPTL